MMRFWIVVCLMGMLGCLYGTASADDQRILDLLLKKGVLTQSEYEDVLKEAGQEQKEGKEKKEAIPPPPVGSLKDLERVPGSIEYLRKNDYKDVFTTVDDLLKHSERLSVGIVALKVQYNADETDRKAFSSTPDTSSQQNTIRDENGFRLRAAEIYVTGRLTPWSTYYVEMDFARQNEIPLNSMYMDFYSKDMPYVNGLSPFLSKVRVGQFREPFGIEQGTSQGLIDFVNRAYYTDLRVGQNGSSVAAPVGDPGLNPFGKDNGSGFVQQLDIGVEVTSALPQLPWRPELQMAVINGAGRNFNDNNADKDVTGRLLLNPLEGMKVYLAAYYGTGFFTNNNGVCPGTSTVIHACTDVKKFRQGAMYTYIPPGFPGLKLQGEYIEGYDNGFRRRTWYQYILFRPFSFLPNFEPAYRYEQFTMDTNRPNSTLTRHTIGFNYYFHTNVKWTVNYEIKHDDNEGNPFDTSPSLGGANGNPNNNNFFTTQIQFRY